MGACATKPKVLKDDAQAPVPSPETAAEEVVPQVNKKEKQSVPVIDEVKDKKVVESEGDDRIKEIVDDDKAEDHSTKRRSLSHFFKESEDVKESAESVKAPEEPVKPESSVTEKPKGPTVLERSVTLINPAEPVTVETPLTKESVEPAKEEQLGSEPAVSLKQGLSTAEKAREPEKGEQKVTEKPVEPLKQEPLATEKSAEVSETKLPEAKKSEIPVEPNPRLSVAGGPVKVVAEKVIGATSAAVDPKTSTGTTVEKKSEEIKDLTLDNKA
ncbi:hypothetical protein P3X46_012916 [Hevea brasiliensis]|uniref:Uncharacterized protein n=1 Tax=Hevea brasiliensis TaxID=3981 RepID=A0ABQ9MBS3_HEVBR|nr:uncharacterized protein LOC110636428 [Hevea brasiliensis]KAJ9177727.1 hypothetical protein P3X46_012916 [Hevea brasiliensis]